MFVTSSQPSKAAGHLDDARLNMAAISAARVAGSVIRAWCGDQFADAHGCYSRTASRVWTDWAVLDQRNLWQVLKFGDACLREWRQRRGVPHGATKGLNAALMALSAMEVPAPQLPGLKQPPPYTGPEHLWHGGGSYGAYRAALCLRWERAAGKGRPPVWTGRAAPSWYDGAAVEVVL